MMFCVLCTHCVVDEQFVCTLCRHRLSVDVSVSKITPGNRQVLLKYSVCLKKKIFCTKGEKVHILSLDFNCSSMFYDTTFFFFYKVVLKV